MQYLALRTIAQGDLVGADLARRATVSPAAVSQLLAGLEEAGLLERTPMADDRRRQSLSLTTQGLDVLRSVEAGLRERLGGLLADLPPPEAHALAEMLQRIEPLLTGEAPPPRPRRPHPPGPGKRRATGRP